MLIETDIIVVKGSFIHSDELNNMVGIGNRIRNVC